MVELKMKPSFKEIARLLDDNGITWAVFAGMAAFAYGSPRLPTNVDILVPVAEGDRVAALFPKARATRHKGVKVVRLPGFGILAAGLPDMDLDEQMAARLTRHEIAGVTVPVIPPEDNILIKGLRGQGPEVGKHDWEDVQEMMMHLPTLDWKYVDWRASMCEPREHVEQVLEQLKALWRQVGKGPTDPDSDTTHQVHTLQNQEATGAKPLGRNIGCGVLASDGLTVHDVPGNHFTIV